MTATSKKLPLAPFYVGKGVRRSYLTGTKEMQVIQNLKTAGQMGNQAWCAGSFQRSIPLIVKSHCSPQPKLDEIGECMWDGQGSQAKLTCR